MVTLILCVLTLFVVQTLLPSAMRYLVPSDGASPALQAALGPRDEQPPASPMTGRAQRALANLQEALPVFLTLALLHVMRDAENAQAVRGATVFAIARALYVPAYLSGIPGLRSVVWGGGWVGLGLMIAAL